MREDTWNYRRPSERGTVRGKTTREKKQLAYLLCALLLSQHFVLLGDHLRFVFEDEGERKADEKGGRGHHPDGISGKFCGALEERRGF
jgi:hypothetical protein